MLRRGAPSKPRALYASRLALGNVSAAPYERTGVTIPVSETGETMPWHSLRHTFGTECAARGVPVPTIKELMGHADIKTTMRYVTVNEAQKDAAIDQAFGTGWPASGQPVANNSASSS